MQEERKREREFRTTVDGTVIKRVYSPAELAKFKQDNGLPGEYPFTRHIMSGGYRSRLGK